MQELETRIRGRSTESEEIIQKRLAKARKELPFKKDYRYHVINDSLERCAEEIKSIIKKESQNL